ncbi:MAG: methionine synthase [Aeromicrobium erythreum]
MRFTGVGSMPGEDLGGTLRLVLDDVEVPFVPELPARGVAAQMTGRSLALLEGLAADLQPAGWRLVDAPGVDHRRARSLLAQDLDALEEAAHDWSGPLKQQVTGPWTLAATTELLRGEKVLADHGARRDLAESLAAGVAEHVADLRRRVPGAELVVQVDEPALPAVLAARVPTASGFGRYRTIDAPEADAALRVLAGAVRDAGARPVVHSCASDVPVALLRGAGFTAISFDLSLARPDDAWAEAFEAGVDLWPGILPSTDAPLDASGARRRLDGWFDRLGFAQDSWDARTTITPTCGLAGASRDHVRGVLAALRSLAA